MTVISIVSLKYEKKKENTISENNLNLEEIN